MKPPTQKNPELPAAKFGNGYYYPPLVFAKLPMVLREDFANSLHLHFFEARKAYKPSLKVSINNSPHWPCVQGFDRDLPYKVQGSRSHTYNLTRHLDELPPHPYFDVVRLPKSGKKRDLFFYAPNFFAIAMIFDQVDESSWQTNREYGLFWRDEMPIHLIPPEATLHII